MSELAFNINGERFDLPESASYWRVRRFKASGRGTPEVVYADDGLPLIIPIETEIGEFRKLVHGVHGRYRLDPVDDNHKSCEEGTAAYLQLNDEPPVTPKVVGGSRSDGGDDLLREIVRANFEMVKNIADKFATVMDSTAALLRAADGAGLPAREPRQQLVPLQLASAWRNAEQPDDRDEEDGDEESGGTAQLVRLIENVATQAMPLVKHHIHTKVMGLSPEQSLAMMTGAVAPSSSSGSSSSKAGEKAKRPSGRQSEASEPPPDPSAQFFMHLAAIEQHLTPEEAQLARYAIQQLSPETMASWRDRIMKMSPVEAAELVRGECRRLAESSTAEASAGDGEGESEKEAA